MVEVKLPFYLLLLSIYLSHITAGSGHDVAMRIARGSSLFLRREGQTNTQGIIGFLNRPNKQPEKKYKPENTNYKFRNVRNNIFEAKAPFNAEHAVSFFSSILSATKKSSFSPPELPEGFLMTLTKQVATLGPATSEVESIRSVFDAGVDVFRLNFAHGTRLSKLKAALTIRQLEADPSFGGSFEDRSIVKHKALLGDIQGPKLRIGRFMPNLDVPGVSLKRSESEFVELKKGDEFTFDTYDVVGNKKRVQLNFPDILKGLNVGEVISLDDGNAIMRVVSTNPSEPSVTAVVENDCILSSRKGFAVPNMLIPVELLTEKDVKDAIFCLAAGVDFLGVSFVQTGSDLLYLKNILNDFYTSPYFQKLRNRLSSMDVDEVSAEGEDAEIEELLGSYYNESFLPKKEVLKTYNPPDNGPSIGIIPKIEKQHALDDIHRILQVSDGLMIARGDLGVETDITNIPIIQKRLIQLCRLVYHKPCIVATQMLESMRKSPVPTRAEVTDVSNAVYDGADAVMLSAESATGQHPLKTVYTQRRILFNTENDPYFPTFQLLRELLLGGSLESFLGTSRPKLLGEVNELLQTDIEHASDWIENHRNIKEAADIVSDAIVKLSVDALLVRADDRGELIQWIASLRHNIPVILLTTNVNLSRKLQLTWSVKSCIIPHDENAREFSKNLISDYDLSIKKALLMEFKDNTISSSDVIET